MIRRFQMGGSGLCAEAKALLARMTTQPDPNQKRAINRFILGSKAAGLWSKYDALWMPSPWAEQAFTLNWISTSFTLTKTATGISFTSDGGYESTGASTSIYVDTHYTPSSDGDNFALNSGRVSVLADIIAGGTNGSPFGHTTPNAVVTTTANAFSGGINSATTDTFNNSVDVNADEALFSVVRRGASEVEGYKNGSSLGSETTASSGLPGNSLLMFARHQGGPGIGVVSGPWKGKIRHAAVSSAFSDAEEANAYSLLMAYDAAVNA